MTTLERWFDWRHFPAETRVAFFENNPLTSKPRSYCMVTMYTCERSALAPSPDLPSYLHPVQALQLPTCPTANQQFGKIILQCGEVLVWQLRVFLRLLALLKKKIHIHFGTGYVFHTLKKGLLVMNFFTFIQFMEDSALY